MDLKGYFVRIRGIVLLLLITNNVYGWELPDNHNKLISNPKQVNSPVTNLTVEEGDVSYKNESKVGEAVSYPDTYSTENKNERSIYSFLGGVSNNKTERHIKLQHELQMLQSHILFIIKNKELTPKEYKYLIDLYEYQSLLIINDLNDNNKKDKLFGLISWGGEGCHILNACGLLSWK